jgi:plastocyanin
MRIGAFLIMALCVPPWVRAAGLTVNATDKAGRALRDVVVTLDEPGSAPAQAAPTADMRQRNKAFDPHVLIVALGTSVRFPNDDPFLHHVYSFSEAKRFELDLYSREKEPVIVFDTPGVVALGCNIHDEMRGYIFVTPAAHFGVSGPDGAVNFAGLAPGSYTLEVWHPRTRSNGAVPVKVLLKNDDINHVSVPLDLKQDRLGGLDEYERGDYE